MPSASYQTEPVVAEYLLFHYGELFGRTGRKVLSHRKLIAFGDIKGPEAIKGGNTIAPLDTPFGLVGMPICRNFCEAGHPFDTPWESIGAGFLLVPAMGGRTSVRAHRKTAEKMLRSHGAVSAVANQDPHSGNKHRGLVCHQLEGNARETKKSPCISVKLHLRQIDETK